MIHELKYKTKRGNVVIINYDDVENKFECLGCVGYLEEGKPFANEFIEYIIKLENDLKYYKI